MYVQYLPLLLDLVEVDHVHNLSDAEAAAPVGPHHLVLEELGRFPNPRPILRVHGISEE